MLSTPKKAKEETTVARISVRFASEQAGLAEAQRQAHSRQQTVFLVRVSDEDAWFWEVHDAQQAGQDSLPVGPR